MKQFLFSPFLAALMTGCSLGGNKPAPVPSKAQTLFVAGLDFSKSTADENAVMYFDSSIARSIYTQVANAGGGCIKIVGIYTNSLAQEIISINVPVCDTITISGIRNVYLREKAKKENIQRMVVFARRSDQDIQRLIEVTQQPHESQYSDVGNALLLIKAATEQGAYTGWAKVVALFSDLKHDLPGTDNDTLSPIELTNTTVVCVRPAMTKEKISRLFPSSTVEVLTSPHDITTIFQTIQN